MKRHIITKAIRKKILLLYGAPFRLNLAQIATRVGFSKVAVYYALHPERQVIVTEKLKADPVRSARYKNRKNQWLRIKREQAREQRKRIKEEKVALLLIRAKEMGLI